MDTEKITIPIAYNGLTPSADKETEIVSGQRLSLRVRFTFSEDWDAYPARTAVFDSRSAIRKQDIDADGYADIPSAVIKNGVRYVKISVFGNTGEDPGEIPRYNGRPLTLRVDIGGTVTNDPEEATAYEKLLIRVIAVEESLGEAVEYANTAAENADRAAAGADDSATNANRAADNADDSATNADRAAGSADDSAANANRAAERADESSERLEEAAANAEQFVRSAALSATNAKDSENNAGASETAAAESAESARVSRIAAESAEADAKNSKTAAAESEKAAKASQTAAKTSETNAAASERAAKESEEKAAQSVTEGAYVSFWLDDDGALWMDKTQNADELNFYADEDGAVYMEVVAQ